MWHLWHLWHMQVRLWPKNEAGLKKMVGKSRGLLTVGKIANFAIAMYLVGKNKPKP